MNTPVHPAEHLNDFHLGRRAQLPSAHHKRSTTSKASHRRELQNNQREQHQQLDMIYVQKQSTTGDQSKRAILDNPLFLETVGPSNFSVVDGNSCITNEGLRRFSLAVLAGILPGNRAAAQLFLKFTESVASL